MLVHDSFSSVGVTLALAPPAVRAGRWRYAGRTGSLAEYRRGRCAGASACQRRRQLAQLPWFARNVAVKVAIVTGARPVARALGHREGPWPY